MAELSGIQIEVLEVLAGFRPSWTLTGGGALVAVHLGNRSTRDLDLFWHGLRELGAISGGVEERLVRAGLDVSALERSPGFVRLHVRRDAETTIVDLVAEPVPFAEAPTPACVGAATIMVDTAHEILVNKLGALLSRSELRDLQDACTLVRAGGDLERALMDAARKDGGMSAATLAWVLEQLPVDALGSALGFTPPDLDALKAERNDLVDRLVALARPDQ